MLAKRLLHKVLEKSLSHQGKKASLLEAVDSLISRNELWLCGLGRGIKNGNTPKSNINKIDRLIGSELFHKERCRCYHVCNDLLLKDVSQPIIAVDWSDTPASCSHQLLSATIWATIK